MPAITILDHQDTQVPEGASHHYQCEFVEASGATLAIGAVTAILGWLDALPGGAAINGRTEQDILNLNEATLVDGPAAVPPRAAGIGVFTWKLTPADAVIASLVEVSSEFHRITLKVTYTPTGGGSETLSHEVRYRVVALTRIT